MRALAFVLLIMGAALAAGGPILAYEGYMSAQAAFQTYVRDCLVPDATSSCLDLRYQVDTSDTMLLEGLILTFVGADLLVLGLLFATVPSFKRMLPAPR